MFQIDTFSPKLAGEWLTERIEEALKGWTPASYIQLSLMPTSASEAAYEMSMQVNLDPQEWRELSGLIAEIATKIERVKKRTSLE